MLIKKKQTAFHWLGLLALLFITSCASQQNDDEATDSDTSAFIETEITDSLALAEENIRSRCLQNLDGITLSSLDSESYMKLSLSISDDEKELKVRRFFLDGVNYGDCIIKDGKKRKLNVFVKHEKDSIEYSLVSYSPSSHDYKFSFSITASDLKGNVIGKVPAEGEGMERKLKNASIVDNAKGTLKIKRNETKTVITNPPIVSNM